MTYGFQVKNSANQDIIRGIEETYLLYKKGTIYQTIPAYPHGNLSAGYNHDVLGGLTIYDELLLYVSYDFGHLGCNLAVGIQPASMDYNSGGIYSSRAVINVAGYGIGSNYPAVIHYWVFAKARHVPLPAYGMVLYNDQGVIAFHNGAKPMNITGFVDIPPTPFYANPKPLPYYRNDAVYAYRSLRAYQIGRHGTNGEMRHKAFMNLRTPFITRSHY